MSQRQFERQARKRQAAEKRGSSRRRRAGLAAGAVGTAVLFAPSAAHAVTFEVDKLSDAAPLPGACTGAADDCTLREAIELANANGEGDTITFAGGVVGTITLTQGQLTINSPDPLTIDGPGAAELEVSGKDESRVFNIEDGGAVSIFGLRIDDGDGSPDAGNADAAGAGGAIRTEERLELTDCVVTGSTATSGGGLATAGATTLVLDSTAVTASHATAGRGGGIDSHDPLTLTDSTISGNTATGGGGGVAHTPKYIGAFFGAGDMTATDTTIAGNSAVNGGGLLLDASDPTRPMGPMSARSRFRARRHRPPPPPRRRSRSRRAPPPPCAAGARSASCAPTCAATG